MFQLNTFSCRINKSFTFAKIKHWRGVSGINAPVGKMDADFALSTCVKVDVEVVADAHGTLEST